MKAAKTMSVADVAREAGVSPKVARARLRRSRKHAGARWPRVARGSQAHKALLAVVAGAALLLAACGDSIEPTPDGHIPSCWPCAVDSDACAALNRGCADKYRDTVPGMVGFVCEPGVDPIRWVQRHHEWWCGFAPTDPTADEAVCCTPAVQ